MYMNYEKKATADNYLWTTTGNVIQILPSDKNFHREGSYYLTIVPKANFW
jgi:hypothetical protein